MYNYTSRGFLRVFPWDECHVPHTHNYVYSVCGQKRIVGLSLTMEIIMCSVNKMLRVLNKLASPAIPLLAHHASQYTLYSPCQYL